MAKLQGIQALRGIAAVAVILYHVARHVDRACGAPALARLFRSGHAGVDLFFVLSGFVILHVHGRDIGRPDRLAHYARQRATRVLPLYWVALAVTVAMMAAGSGGAPDAARLFWSATLLPTAQPPVLGIAWTLRYELLFYAVFALLIVHRAAGIAALALWGLVVLLPRPVAPGALAAQLGDLFNLHFFMGMAVARLARRPVLAPRATACAGALLLAATGVAESLGAVDGYSSGARLLYGPAAALLILGLTGWERAHGLTVPAWLLRLGEASYSLYLFQFVFLGIAWKLLTVAGLAAPLPPVALFALLSLAAIAGGLAAAAWVERPLLRRFRPHHAAPAR